MCISFGLQVLRCDNMKKRIRVAFGEFRFRLSNFGPTKIDKNPRYLLNFSTEGASTLAELKRMQTVPYASAVGSIMYVVRYTHSDVAFAQNITSRFQYNPGDLHWTTIKNIMKYLKNTKDMFLVYECDIKQELRVSCYTDSTKQSIFVTSSVEAEYIAAYDASKEAVWVRNFNYGLGVVPTIEEAIKIYCDNTEAIAIANESEITKGARHFHAKVHYLYEVIE
nr:hypothetical protein [Tanacetum cinerariifolium]